MQVRHVDGVLALIKPLLGEVTISLAAAVVHAYACAHTHIHTHVRTHACR